MGLVFLSYTNILLAVSGLLLLGIVIDQLYQKLSHLYTGEPPLLPYRIPIIGHALAFGNNSFDVFKAANERWPDGRPFSLMFFGKRVYIVPHNREVSVVFRKARALPFLPLIESLSGLAWDISADGMKRLSESDETGDSLFKTAHFFYRDAMKPGPQLNELTLNFLHYLNQEFDKFEASGKGTGISLFNWSRNMLGVSSTNAMMGPSLLQYDPDMLPSVWQVESGFFLFVNKIPRIFAKKHYVARDRVLKACTAYFEDEKNREGSAPMIWDREVDMRNKGMKTRDIAAYSYSAYTALLNNANPTAYHLLRHIFTHKNKQSLARLRAEVAPAFSLNNSTSNSVTTLEQVQYLITFCPLLRAFYDETLRLHSSTSSNRVVVEETVIGGFTFKPGHNVICPSYAQHHSPEYFGSSSTAPSPEKFEPDRFLTPGVLQGPGGDLLPANAKMVRAFGGGVSLCSGRFFASNEVLSYAASVLWRFDMTWRRDGMVDIVPRKS